MTKTITLFFRRLERRSIWTILAFLVACSGQAQPNIVFILVDDLGWKDLGFMGSRLYETPNIDRLAAEGLIFTQAYAASAVCSPTRASILTGKYPARLGITDWIRGRQSGVIIPEDHRPPAGFDTLDGLKLATPKNALWLDLDEITLAEALKKAGYTTAHIGKWHLGPGQWKPESQGFDYNFGGTDYGQPPSYFDPFEANNLGIESLPPVKTGQYLTDREADEAVRFIRRHQDKPFFLNIWHYTVHTPLQAKDTLVQKYLSKQAADPDLPDFRPDIDGISARFATRLPMQGQRNPVYAAMIESLDHAVGRVTHTLDELGLSENTIVVFFSDNGGHIVSTDNSPLRLGKGHPYEGGIREPLIIRYPKRIPKGQVTGTPVCSIDFYPTLLSLAGAPVPASQPLDGIDLSGLLLGDRQPERDALYWHFPHYWWDDKVRPHSIILENGWKLIRHYEDQSLELYDLFHDIGETRNLAMEFPVIAQRLNERLTTWLKTVNAQLPVGVK